MEINQSPHAQHSSISARAMPIGYNLKLSPVLDVCHNDIKLGSKIPEIHIQIHKHPYTHTHTHTHTHCMKILHHKE